MASFTELTAPPMPEGYCEDDFQFSKLFKCVNVVGQKVLCEVVKAMYSHTLLNSSGEGKTLRQYLISQKWSNRKVKDCFTKDHHELLDVDLINVEFDISFACTVMTLVCKDLFDKMSCETKLAVEELKKLRNRICHKYGLTCSECSTLMDFLKDILKDVYLGVGTIVGKDFSDNISCMESEIQSILSAEISHVDDKTYSDGVEKFRSNLRFKMINAGKRELQLSCSKLRILNPHIWITEEGIEKTPLSKYQVHRLFTPLNMDYSKNNIKIAEIFSVTERIEGLEQVPSAIVMYGLSGCGKTFLCHYLIHEWCKDCDQNVTDLDKFDLIIFVEVRHVQSKTMIEFLEKECLLETCKDFKTSDIIPTLKDLNILIVVDGFEEAKIGTSLNLVGDIFCKFGDKCILLTTLPEYKDDVLSIARKYKVSAFPVQIHGFDERNLRIFSEKVFGTLKKGEAPHAEELNSFLNYIETTGKGLGRNLKLPLTLSLLVYLWSLDSRIASKISSTTMLYQEIFKLCQKRSYERLEKTDIELLENKDREKLKYELDKIFFCLGQQAWSLLLKGELMCLTEKEVKSMESCWRLVDVLDFLSNYLYCESEENNPVQKRSFVFFHKTQMEYLAGAYLANRVTLGSYSNLSFEDIDVEVENGTGWQNLLEVIKFMTGNLAVTEMLKANEMSEILEILRTANISSTDYNFWWNFYLETLKNEHVGCIIIDKLPQSVWILDDEHVVSGLSFYRDLDVNLEILKIEIPVDVDPYDIKELLTTLKEIRCKKMECMQADKKIDPVMIELHFLNHESTNTFSKLSDSLLSSLNPWGHLTSFTGALGEQEILSSCDKLEAIRVRLNSVNAFSTFKISLGKISKTVKTLCVTLAIPFSCSPSELCDLEYTGNFELRLMGANDELKEWIAGVVKLISGRNGCHKLSLVNSEMTCETIHYLLKELENTVHEKISFNTINKLTNEELEELRELQMKDFLEIS
ncbi:uncharacterized protein LOC135213053 [Macrobrachium nipponense]|uniref:uncharacterized protein LOC135213053 n=1 Tax=Macrobrachium nipponense TaxID=159736 RepID=UPI0030C842F2